MKLCLKKAISSVPYKKGAKCGHVKSVSIDMPCSQNLFLDTFVSNVESIKYSGESKYKCFVSVCDLKDVFRENWHTFTYQRSQTHHRVIGLIQINFRQKTMSEEENTQWVTSFWLRLKFSTVKENVQVQQRLANSS